YQDGQFVPEDQHPSFKNRVDLQDRQMKDGDASLILKDVTIHDAGTYKCRSGQDVTLTCRAPNNNIRGVQWRRDDLKADYNRVDLQNRQMKDGDVSLILKNVTIDDAGTYKCHIFIRETGCWQLINSISLRVIDPPGE
uniref:Ig-like domain-containing protein n=1 Tax=Oreochromis aureus TaxID=47969 RepID=A0AAZ1WWR2_OREAU